MNLPSQFTEYTRRLLGEALYARLAEGLDSEDCPTSIRLNPFKASGYDASAAVADTAVPWCSPTGRYLKARPNFTFDPLLHAGMYYVQEAASMFIHHAVTTFIQSPVRMLDLCAAPGGKSTALRAALPEGSLLFSNEPMRTRGTDSEREHSEVRTRRCGRHQQLSTRLPQGGNDIRCHSCRCPVFRRGNVSQGRGGAGGMEARRMWRTAGGYSVRLSPTSGTV